MGVVGKREKKVKIMRDGERDKERERDRERDRGSKR